jgi:hypothetical protein
LSLFHRYGGEDDKLEKRAARFIGEDAVQQAKRLGFALRAALVLAGPAPSVLQETSIKLTPTTLALTIPRSHQALIAEAMTKRLDSLAAAFGKVARVELR